MFFLCKDVSDVIMSDQVMQGLHPVIVGGGRWTFSFTSHWKHVSGSMFLSSQFFLPLGKIPFNTRNIRSYRLSTSAHFACANTMHSFDEEFSYLFVKAT